MKKVLLKDIFRNNAIKAWLLFTFALILLLIYLSMYVSPIVYLTTNIKPVSEKDYNLFLQYDESISLENKVRDNCRLFVVEINIKKPFLLVKSIKVEKESLEEYLFDNSGNGVFNLSSYSADSAHYWINGIEVYSAGMTDEKVKSFFADYKIEISWVDLFNNEHKEFYYLKDYYE